MHLQRKKCYYTLHKSFFMRLEYEDILHEEWDNFGQAGDVTCFIQWQDIVFRNTLAKWLIESAL